MKILEHPAHGAPPPHRLLYRGVDGCYCGWTGSDYLGVIRPLNGGWVVTAWSDMMKWLYGDPRIEVYFTDLDDAVREVGDLMDIAERLYPKR